MKNKLKKIFGFVGSLFILLKNKVLATSIYDMDPQPFYGVSEGNVSNSYAKSAKSFIFNPLIYFIALIIGIISIIVIVNKKISKTVKIIVITLLILIIIGIILMDVYYYINI